MKKLLTFILLASVGLVGCATNPVTGNKELSLISEAQELSIGKQQYEPTGSYQQSHPQKYHRSGNRTAIPRCQGPT